MFIITRKINRKKIRLLLRVFLKKMEQKGVIMIEGKGRGTKYISR